MRQNPKITGRAWLLAGLILICGGFASWPAAGGEHISADEYSLKAAFIYNLARFVDWPGARFHTEDCPLIIGVAGDGAFEKIRAVVAHKTIGRHDIIVRPVATKQDAEACHVLFFSRAQKDGISDLVTAAAASAVLTVGETDNFLESGGMIRFYIESESIRLVIDEAAIRRAGVAINANALSTLINKKIARLRKV